MARFDNFPDFYRALSPEQHTHITSLVDWVRATYPDLEPVIAWNQPMFKKGTKYILGFMPTKNHTNLLTVTDSVVSSLKPALTSYKHGTRSIQLPFDWTIDPQLFAQVISLRLHEEGM